MARRFAESMSPETVQLYYQITLVGLRDLAMAPDPRCGFEMVMLRLLAFQPLDAPLDSAAPSRSTATNSDQKNGRNVARRANNRRIYRAVARPRLLAHRRLATIGMPLCARSNSVASHA